MNNDEPSIGDPRLSQANATEPNSVPEAERPNDETTSSSRILDRQRDEEWANALTHGSAAVASVFGLIALYRLSAGQPALQISCVIYMAAVFGTFTASMLSHSVFVEPWWTRFRALDQAMIFGMIAGTYTPIAIVVAPTWLIVPLFIGMWGFAMWGILSKAIFHHRVNNMSPYPCIFLGWFPAVALAWYTPLSACYTMLLGGVLYSLGVLFLMNDHKVKYFHAVWHLMVIAAALIHYGGIWRLIVAA